MPRRSVTVEIPDDDSAERTLRVVADGLLAGEALIVFRRPANIPDSDMPGLFARMAVILEAASVLRSAFGGDN